MDNIEIKQFSNKLHQIAWHAAQRPSMYGVEDLNEYCILIFGVALGCHTEEHGFVLTGFREFVIKKVKAPKNWCWVAALKDKLGNTKENIEKVYQLLEEYYKWKK